MKSVKPNPNVLMVVEAVMGVFVLVGGVFLYLHGGKTLAGAMIGAVVSAFFLHGSQALGSSTSLSTIESSAAAVLSAVDAGTKISSQSTTQGTSGTSVTAASTNTSTSAGSAMNT